MIRFASTASRARNRVALPRVVLPSSDTSLPQGETTLKHSCRPQPQLHHGVRDWSTTGSQFLSFHSGYRHFSSGPSLGDGSEGSTTDGSMGASTPTVEETLDKLFAENQEQASAATGDALQAIANAWEPTWYNIADQAVLAVKAFHDLSGIEYGWSIVAVTAIIRVGLFPLMVSAQQTSSRMAHLQPELNQMRQRYEALGTPSRQERIQFGERVKGLFTRYKVKPGRAFLAPALQLPLFMGMFFGLRKMPGIYPEEFAVGGMLWFPDLTVPDPMYILPVMSGVTFFAIIELGKEQMLASGGTQGPMMLNMFRLMSLGMVPFIMTFDSAMLCYWTANNVFTLSQTGLLKVKRVRDYFGIWDRPKPVPGQEAPSMTEMMEKIMKKSRGEPTSEKQAIEQHNQAVETKKRAVQVMRSAREKRRDITGTTDE